MTTISPSQAKFKSTGGLIFGLDAMNLFPCCTTLQVHTQSEL